MEEGSKTKNKKKKKLLKNQTSQSSQVNLMMCERHHLTMHISR